MATPEGASFRDNNNALERLTPLKPPIEPERLSGGMANPLTAFRAVMIAGRFVCLERAHG